jgi:hypothetical protein
MILRTVIWRQYYSCFPDRKGAWASDYIRNVLEQLSTVD